MADLLTSNSLDLKREKVIRGIYIQNLSVYKLKAFSDVNRKKMLVVPELN